MANKWFSALLGFFVPPLAFVYLAKLPIAAIFFLLSIGSVAADYYVAPLVGFAPIALLLSFVSAVYAFILAKKVQFGDARKWFSHWWGVLSIPVTFFSLVFLIRSFVVEPFAIPSASMSPALEVGDHILVYKWGYGLYGSYGITLASLNAENRTKPKRGEPLVLNPRHDSRPFVERIIGLPGDLVEFSNKQLLINGIPVETEDLGGGFFKEKVCDTVFKVKYIGGRSQLRTGRWVVPGGHYFVMGDNRDNSLDSRSWGMVPAENIVGRILIKW